MRHSSHIPVLKGGQGHDGLALWNQATVLWPGLFRIGLVGLLIMCAVLVAHVVTKRNQSLAQLAQLKSTSVNQTNN